MEEKNPLYFIPQRSSPKFNKSGRPTNDDIIKFSPQPCSQISQMLKKIMKEKDDVIISKCGDTESETYIVHDSGNETCEDIHCDTVDFIEPKDGVKSENDFVDKSKRNNTLFSCDFPKCKYSSKSSSNLIKHKRTHTMEKPYLCDLCSFRSNFVNSLKVHKRIHTKERPYCCKYCSYRCNSSSNLKKHCKHRHWNVI